VNPFAALGLPARPDLTDEQVRAAWRTTAAATHPDRDDGGNPSRYAAASAAYAALRTPWGRSEAYADYLATTQPARPTDPVRPAAPGANLAHSLRLAPARAAHGRPLRLALRALAAVLLSVTAVNAGAGVPATAGTVTGLLLWLVLTLRADLAPPPGR
jgi:hypothetical protein